eukprot:jgi/Astpho2/3444/Aster-07044
MLSRFPRLSGGQTIRCPVAAHRRGLHVVAAAGGEVVSKKDNQGIVQFQPFKEVTTELTHVEDSSAAKQGPEDSFSRVGYHRESELAVNQQINIELNMSYAYQQVSSFFNRDNIALPGMVNYFRAASLEERDHAEMLMDFQNRRGGRVKLAHITAPQSEFGDPKRSDVLHAMELALSFEKLNFQKLRELHDTAEKHGDAQMADFVEDMLTEQAGDVKKTADYVAQLRRVGDGHGLWHWQNQLQVAGEESVATPSASG